MSLPYQGDLVVMPDGSEWLAAVLTAPFAYTAAYAQASDAFKSPHGVLNGPYSGGHRCNSNSNFAYDPATTTWVISYGSNADGDATNGFQYHRSTDGGATWTTLTFPNGKTYTVWFVGGQFVGYISNTTTNGCITSSDGVTWTSRTAVSVPSVGELVGDGGNQLLVLGHASTTGAFSTDAGATWTSCTLPAAWASISKNNGYVAWCPSAGLYVAPTNTAGAYATSPTGATWTHRTTSQGIATYGSLFGNTSWKVAASASLIVAVASGGFVLTSTDALTWSNANYITSSSVAGGSAPWALLYDGTRFVAVFGSRVFYSTNGTSWSEGGKLLPTNVVQDVVTSGRVLRIFGTNRSPTAVPLMVDPTLTAPAFIFPYTASQLTATNTTYYRIK